MAQPTGKGLPRTAKAADLRKLKKVKLSRLPKDELDRFNFVKLDGASRRAGTLGLIGTVPDHPPKTFPGQEPGTYIVCYYDPNTGDYTDCRVHDGG